MIKKKKTYQKDNYGRYVKSHEFDRYWDEYHNLEDISMKESIRQRKEREKNIKNSKFVPLNGNNHVILEGDEGWYIFKEELKNFLKQ